MIRCRLILSFLIVAGAVCAEDEAKNLLPVLAATTGHEPHWEMVRTQETRVDARGRDFEQAGAVLELKVANDAGYGEWRVKPLVEVAPETGYQCRAKVSGYAEAAPYLEIYAYGEDGTSKLVGHVAGKIGRFEDDVLQCRFTTPAKTKRLRVGIGLSKAKGEIKISEATLLPVVEGETPAVVESFPKKVSLPSPVADWLWIRSDPGLPTVVFRKAFTLDRVPETAFAQVTADNAYKLSINGKPICEDSNWKTLEVRDIAGDLVKGDNVVEIEVDNFDDVGGVLFHARLHGVGGSEGYLDVASDATWTARKKDGTALEIADLGPAPHPPWKTISLEDIQPPKRIAAEVVEQTESVTQGDVFKAVLRLRNSGKELEEARLTVRNAANQVAVSGAEAYCTRTGDLLTVELPISRYGLPGRHSLHLGGSDFVIEADFKDLQITNSSFGSTKPSYWPVGGGNKVETRAGVQAPFSYASILKSTEGRYQAWQSTGGHLYEVEADASADYPASGQWNLFPIERQLIQILEADPEACVQLRVRLDMPAWWLTQNPNDRFRSNAGRSGKQSFASDKWRAEAITATASLVQQLWQRPVGQAVGGVLICAFRGGEFQLWGEDTGEYDISPVAQDAFRHWQEKAGTPKKQLIALPQEALAMPFEPGEENEEIRCDFFHFLASRQAENICAIASGIKGELGGQFPVTVYYGYLFEHAYNLRRLLFGGGLGFQKVAEEPAVDSISCPASYALRGPGGPQAFMYPVTSVLLHHKVPVLEDDVRNFLSPHPSDSSGERLHDLASTILSMRKMRWLAATQGASVRYLTAFGDPVDTMQDPTILAELNALNTEVMALEPSQVGASGQIALVVDPGALCQAGELPGELVRAALCEVRRDLAKVGRSVAYLTMADWQRNSEKWETVVVPLPGLLAKEQQATLARVFGELPGLSRTTPFLVLDKKAGISVCENLAKSGELPGASQARDGKRFWYIGGNFTAWADQETGRLEMSSSATTKQGDESH